MDQGLRRLLGKILRGDEARRYEGGFGQEEDVPVWPQSDVEVEHTRDISQLDPEPSVQYLEPPPRLRRKLSMRRLNWKNCSGILVLTPFLASFAWAQQEEEKDLRQQIEELKKGQDEIRKELADIKKLLQASAARAAAPAAPDVRNLVLDVGSNPFRGEATAKLTLVEFTDYQ